MMMKYILLILLTIYCFDLHSQKDFDLVWNKNSGPVLAINNYFRIRKDYFSDKRFDKVAVYGSDSIKIDPETYEFTSDFFPLKFKQRDDNLFEVVILTSRILKINLIDTIKSEIYSIYETCKPLPVKVFLNNYHDQQFRIDTIRKSRFDLQTGLIAMVLNMDINARCSVLSYDMTFIKNNLKWEVNRSNPFEEAAKSIDFSKFTGSNILFSNILFKCPGDYESRKYPYFIVHLLGE